MIIPNLREFLILRYDSGENFFTVARKFFPDADDGGLAVMCRDFVRELEEIRNSSEHLQVPHIEENNDDEQRYFCNSQDVKIVSDYTNLNFNEVYETDILTYWAWLHDAVVWIYSKSEEGIDYLDKCWKMAQSEPDRESIKGISGGAIKLQRR